MGALKCFLLAVTSMRSGPISHVSRAKERTGLLKGITLAHKYSFTFFWFVLLSYFIIVSCVIPVAFFSVTGMAVFRNKPSGKRARFSCYYSIE